MILYLGSIMVFMEREKKRRVFEDKEMKEEEAVQLSKARTNSTLGIGRKGILGFH